MRNETKGILAIVAAATFWGLSGIYFKALVHVPPLEILSHRAIWSAVFFGAVLALQGRAGEIRAALAQPRTWAILGTSAGLIALNWLGFIHAIQTNRALEAGLGYYMFPLVAVAFGYLFFAERFSRRQATAIGLMAGAVVVLTLGLGQPPMIGLLLAVTFGLYGLIKKRLAIGPVLSVFIETLLLAPPAVIWLWGSTSLGWPDIGGRAPLGFGEDALTAALLLGSGPLTATPLVLFSYAAKRLAYATVGLVQYLNPTLQVAVAALVFGEAVTPWHLLALPMIWAGLALYSWDGLAQERRRRSSAISSATLPTTESEARNAVSAKPCATM
ncbi:MAG TPA: EamA family transporter RarD [Amaricoccus sp.]|uniref:EamA family transporter RarD n=1 Tax=Amaricoccus sp. TaxID=1872485 RepID=UPI002BA4D61E|nr:EamA family transporter RarD [Amaricoccus sp.]HPG22979.1 EamA family transporter RarD [Amaricoccus sp.]HRW14387.1 EamA family transporter RarD [Amaricoccus sp.]